ncbi:hypothetical protein [Kitasatospora sp. NPDC057015]|uniref:hypothetical protein n=1 Tax=Kitasatospora sp. NPDC057015 TaxID=3346001 RepID=UPI00362FDF50
MVAADRAEVVRGFAFVGREKELRSLVGVLSVRPAVVQVQGQAGIGKSRLVVEACAVLRAEGVRVITPRTNVGSSAVATHWLSPDNGIPFRA